MELHQLEYFVAVDKYKKFSRAANEINVSQSTLSDQVRKLEDELGVKLFVRTTRRVQTTAAGRDFLVYARRILSDVQKAHYAMSEYATLLKGTLRIGTIPHATCLGITNIISAFLKEFNNIDISIAEANSDALIGKLNDGEIDLAFITSPYKSGHDIEFHPLIDDRLVLFLSRRHPLAKRAEVDLQELAGEKFLLTKSSATWKNQIIQACDSAGFQPGIILNSTHFETIKAFVQEGSGVTLLTSSVARYIAGPETAIVELKDPITCNTGLALPRCSSTALVTRFHEFVLERIAVQEQ